MPLVTHLKNGPFCAAALLAACGVSLPSAAHADSPKQALYLRPYMNLSHPDVIALLPREDVEYGVEGKIAKLSLELDGLAFSCSDASYELIADGGLLIGGSIFCPFQNVSDAKLLAEKTEARLSKLEGWAANGGRSSDPRRAEEYGRSIAEAFTWLNRSGDPLASVEHVLLSDWDSEAGSSIQLNAANYRKSGSKSPHFELVFGLAAGCLTPLMAYRQMSPDSPDWNSPSKAEIKAHFGNRSYQDIPSAERAALSESYARAVCQGG